MLEKHRSHIPLIAIGTALCLCSLLSVIYLSDPYTDGVVAHLFFYLSLFLTIVGLVTGIGLALRKRFAKGLYFPNLAVSFRQAVLVGILVTSSLLLLSYGILFWWVELTLILFLVFFELFLNL
jgi:hypothetical protein